jgi:uncharacterized protein (TIGR02996 family)
LSVLNAELEAAIVRDPDDLASYAVYGDWLAEHGDPRGELVSTQLAAEATNDPELRRAALRVFAKHRDYFLGALGSMIAADAFTWRAGFIQRAVLSPERLLIEDGARVAGSIAEVVDKLLAHPSAKFLVELVVRSNDRDAWGRVGGSQRAIVERITAARPRVLRRLQLGEAVYGYSSLGPLDLLWPALPELRELVLEGAFSLGKLVLPELRSAALRPMALRRRGAKELIEAAWPKLESLRITFDDYPMHVEREITALVHRTDMPALAHLALIGYRSADSVIEALARAPLLGRLATLDLSQSTVTDGGVRPILANPDAFRHLAVLDLSGTQVSRRQFARLQRLLPNAVATGLTV